MLAYRSNNKSPYSLTGSLTRVKVELDRRKRQAASSRHQFCLPLRIIGDDPLPPSMDSNKAN
jgi:hypothetical protein